MTTNPNQSDGLRDRILWATGQIHDATEWANEPAPDGNGSILDWICRAAQSPTEDEVERPVSAYGYQELFNAIAAATSVYADGAGVNISVTAFRSALRLDHPPAEKDEN